jgi:hypothetical protein
VAGLSSSSPFPERPARSASNERSTNAAHTRAKPIHCAAVIASPNTSTPRRNCSVGVRYCSRPSRVRGIRVAAAANRTRGTAVTTPVPASSREMPIPPDANSARPLLASTTIATRASGDSSRVSPASERPAGRSMRVFRKP